MPRASSRSWSPNPSSQSCQKNSFVGKFWMLPLLDFLAPGFPSQFNCSSRSSTGRVSMENAPGMVTPSPNHQFHLLGAGQGTPHLRADSPQQSQLLGFPLVRHLIPSPETNWTIRATAEGRKSAYFICIPPSSHLPASSLTWINPKLQE